MQTAKVFMHGPSQTVRLPKDFHLKGKEVFIRKNEQTGEIILSEKTLDWDRFFALVDSTDETKDFFPDRKDDPAQKRDLF